MPSGSIVDYFSWGVSVQTLANLAYQETVLPAEGGVFPAVASLEILAQGGSARMVGAGGSGFDAWVTQPRLAVHGLDRMMVADSDLTQTVLALEEGADITAYRDGTHILTLRDGGGRELLRAWIAAYDPVTHGLNGMELLDNELQICGQRERTLATVIYSLPASLGDWQDWTVEIRQQVLARADAGSDRVTFWHDLPDWDAEENAWTGGTAAKVAEQWWMRHTLKLAGGGEASIWKVASVETEFDGSLADGEEIGDQVVLAEAWAGESGFYEVATVFPERSIFFGSAGVSMLDTCPLLGYELQVPSKHPLVAIGQARGLLVALPGAEEIFLYQASGIADPTSLSDSVAFDIRLHVSEAGKTVAGTVASPSLVTDDSEILYGVGWEGPFAFDGVEKRSILAPHMRTWWSRIDPASVPRAKIVMEPDHVFEPALRIVGLWERGGTRPVKQLLYRPGSKSLVDMSDGLVVTAGAAVVTVSGGVRPALGGASRIVLLNGAAREDATDAAQYGMPAVPGATYGAVAEYVVDEEYHRLWITPANIADVSKWGEGWLFTNCLAPFAFIDDAGAWHVFRVIDFDETLGFELEWEEGITDVLNSFRFLTGAGAWVTGASARDEDGDWIAGATSRWVFGAREFAQTVPWFVSRGMNTLMEISGVSLEVEDWTTWNWPLRLEIYSALFAARANNLLKTVYLQRDDLQKRWTSCNLQCTVGTKAKLRIVGIAPPDSHLRFKSVSVETIQHR